MAASADSSPKSIPVIVFLCILLVLQTLVYGPSHFASIDNSIQHQGTTSSATIAQWNPYDPLAIPQGQAENLPSIRIEDQDLNKKRSIYGGQGDKAHLGGFTEIDTQGISPATWKYMVETMGVHSVIDVGCGRGISTTWFLMHGLDVLGVEGSHDAIERSMMPDPSTQIVEHDYSRGPWWPEATYDAVWAVEFLEHVNVQFHFNYISTFRKAALILCTSSRWGGWHHVEVHQDDWWIRKYELYGFRYDEQLTNAIKKIAQEERGTGTGPDGKNWNAQHVWLNMKVFVNPVVAALPQHAHLFPEFGCEEGGEIVHRECGKGKMAGLETPLDPAFYPLNLTEDMDTKWMDHVIQHISLEKAH